MSMTYAGDLTPQQAWDLLREHPRAVLVDVRTEAEWRFVGLPDLTALGREPLTIEWVSFTGDRNTSFVDQLQAAGAKVVLDNVFATPLLQRSLDLGADVIVYSGTKHIDGQGRVLGGAILGPQDYIDGPVQQLIRHTGPALSPFNAHTLLKGLETMPLRVRHSTDSALRIARFLEADDAVSWVKYPFLESHPQYDLATSQMSGGGTVVTFELAAAEGEGKKKAFELLNKLRVVDISNNLGDSKSLITHPATTTHRAMGPEGRAAIGLSDGVVRLSVGLEDTDDLLEDFAQALA